MPLRLLHAALPLAVALSVVPAAALADIYTWVNASGVVTYSDTAPPKDAKLLGVVHDLPARPLSAAEATAARDAAHQAEIRALGERIQLLEREVQLASRAPPPAPYAAPPPPAPCNPAWADCGSWLSPPILGAPVVFIRAPHARHYQRFGVEQRHGKHGGFRRGDGVRLR